MDRLRRTSIDPSASQAPPKKIVGFHVEGVAPSPVPHAGLLSDSELQAGRISGSPNPVIIPPSFQVSIDPPERCCRVGPEEMCSRMLSLPLNDHDYPTFSPVTFINVQTDSPLTAHGGPFSPHAIAVGSAPMHVSSPMCSNVQCLWELFMQTPLALRLPCSTTSTGSKLSGSLPVNM